MKNRLLRISAASLLGSMLLCGCSRGLLKEGPRGEGERGVGLRIPVLDFADPDSYEAENFTPDNIEEGEVNPFREPDRTPSPPEEPFTRYDEDSDYF